MNLEQIKEYILEHGGEEGTPVFTNYCSAFVGLTEDGRAVYDYNKMVNELMDQDGMSEEDAVEWISYNTVRSLPYADELDEREEDLDKYSVHLDERANKLAEWERELKQYDSK